MNIKTYDWGDLDCLQYKICPRRNFVLHTLERKARIAKSSSGASIATKIYGEYHDSYRTPLKSLLIINLLPLTVSAQGTRRLCHTLSLSFLYLAFRLRL